MIETKEKILKSIKKMFFEFDLSCNETKFLDFLFKNLEKQDKKFLKLYKEKLSKRLGIIKILLVNYDIQELINFSLEILLFYDDIYSTYLYHNKLKSKIEKYIPYSVSFLKKWIKFNISIWFSTITTWWDKNQDFTNWINLSIYSNKQNFFTSSFYIGKDSIFISNLQYNKKYFLNRKVRNIKLHRIWILFAYLLWKKFNKERIIWYSNKNHCCSFHPWFYWQYDSFLKWWKYINNNWFWEYYLINNLKNKYLKERKVFNNYILFKEYEK